MRLYYAAVLMTAMTGFACFGSGTYNGGGGGSSSTNGFETVAVYNCADKAIEVFSRPSSTAGSWSYHGSAGTNIYNGTCNKQVALQNAVPVDLGTGGKLVRAVMVDLNSSCDSSDPDGLCGKRDKLLNGDPSGPSTEWKVTYP